MVTYVAAKSKILIRGVRLADGNERSIDELQLVLGSTRVVNYTGYSQQGDGIFLGNI